MMKACQKLILGWNQQWLLWVYKCSVSIYISKSFIYC